MAMAAKHGYWFLIVEPDTEWKLDATKCAKFNTHGVPVETIERMRSDYEKIDQFKLMEKYFPKPVLNQMKSQSRVSTPVKFDAETEVRPKSACGAVGGSHQSTSMDPCSSKAPNPDQSGRNPDQSGQNPIQSGQNPDQSGQNPIQSGQNPIQSGQNPDQSGQNPIQSGQNPIQSGQNRARLNHIFGGMKTWDFPSFPCDPAPSVEVANPPNIIVCNNSSTQTSMRDFALLEALQDGTDILDISDEEVSIEEFSFEVEVPDTEVVRLDKGTDLPVFPGETGEEMINGLKAEFPDLQEPCVIEILKSCCFDREFATLVLKSFDPQHFDDSWIHPEDVVDGASDTSSPSDVTSGSSWTEIDKPSLSMPFTMDIGFALDLQEEFGDVDGSPFDTLTFQLDKETCGSIYEAWKKAVAEKKGKDQQKPAPRQEATPGKKGNDGLCGPRRQEATPGKKGNDGLCGPRSEFEEIVNYEMALEKSLRDVGNEEVARNRETLHRAYPGIGKELLENVFAANGFNLKDTLEQVRSDQKAKNLLAKDTVEQVRSGQKAKNLLAKRTVNEACSRILCNKSPRSPSVQVSSPLASSNKNSETRKKVKDLYKKRLDFMNRARESISSKKFAVASYYSEEAFKCQRMATRLITNSMTWTESNTLDLHELRVNDAMSALNEFMRAKRQQLEHSKNPRMTVDIITGWGSAGIPPKIKPAVQEYLKSNKLW